MKHWLMKICFVALAVSAALAQQKNAVPTQPKPANEGPSLEVTMKFIQDKVAVQGMLDFNLYVHNNQSGLDDSKQGSVEVTNLSVDPANCRLKFKYKITFADGPFGPLAPNSFPAWGGGEQSFDLRSFKQVEVVPANNWWTQEFAEEGFPMKSVRVAPAYFVIPLGRAEKGVDCSVTTPAGTKTVDCPQPGLSTRLALTWGFRDEDMANRIARAMVHAVELCESGSTPEPF